MAKKVKAIIKLQIAAGKANPAPPVGPALGQHGVNIMGFCKEYNERTAKDEGTIIPVEITVFEDRTFTFITKTPPTTDLIKKALGLDKASQNPGLNSLPISSGRPDSCCLSMVVSPLRKAGPVGLPVSSRRQCPFSKRHRNS